MLDFTNCNIEGVFVHHVGNKTNDEDLVLSHSELELSDLRLRELLLRYFLSSFSYKGFESFTFSNGDFKLNPMYQFSNRLFESEQELAEVSTDIAKYLYEVSIHPQIKSGDLFVVKISNVRIDDILVDALGIFKSENRLPFLTMNNQGGQFKVDYDDGIDINKLDKGCLIFDTDKLTGYTISSIDKTSKTGDAHFWRNSFLNIKPCSDGFNQTEQFLGMTKQFVTKQLISDFEVSKTDQIDYLNRSVDYFKSHDSFDKEEFESEVFQDSKIIDSFRSFDSSFKAESDVIISDHFEISADAVKKQVRVFKSILKLDKNFHIYIHGDKKLIEKGTESDGRKYYKIYYNDES